MDPFHSAPRRETSISSVEFGSENFLESKEKNGENGKYCASYYLFTYLHFSFFSLLPLHHPLEQAEAGGSDKYLLETFGCALWVCTQRLNFINWQRQKESFSYLDPSRWRFPSSGSFDLLPTKATRASESRKGGEDKEQGKYWNSIQIIVSFRKNSPRLSWGVYDACLSLWKLDFHSFFIISHSTRIAWLYDNWKQERNPFRHRRLNSFAALGTEPRRP